MRVFLPPVLICLSLVPSLLASGPVALAAEPDVWTNITPKEIAVTGKDNYGIQDVLVDPRHPETLWMFTCRFGCWKSTDFGETWKKVSLDGGPLDKGKNWGEVIAPDGSFMLATSSHSRSIFRSTDGGVTWTPSAETTIHPYNVDIDPDDKNHVISAGHDETNLIESTDGGQTWVDQGPMGGMSTSGYVHFLMDGSTVLAVSADRPATWRGVRAQGKWTWSKVSDQFHDHGSHQVLVDRKRKWIFNPGAGRGLGIERSSDNGLTWTTVTKQAADSIVASPTTIYAMRSFPIHEPFEPRIQHSTDRTGAMWVDVPKPRGMTNGAKCMAVTFDGKNYIIVAGCWSGGLWRFVEPAARP